jgi:hypothetical protein
MAILLFYFLILGPHFRPVEVLRAPAAVYSVPLRLLLGRWWLWRRMETPLGEVPRPKLDDHSARRELGSKPLLRLGPPL